MLIETYLESGKAYDAQNRPEDAYKAFTKAIDLKPSADEGYLALADFAAAHRIRQLRARRSNEG